MSHNNTFIVKTLCTGATAGIATTLAVAASGERDQGEAIAPINAISHIVWGDEAATHDEISFKYTATGLALNAAAVMSWAAMHEFFFGKVSRESLACAFAGGAVISSVAYVTDYHVVPPRLMPGFEKRVAPRSMLPIYASLAIGLGLGSWLQRR